jgi:hypothetical protein
MADPERNPHFRRRWSEAHPELPPARLPPSGTGTLGVALHEALTRARRRQHHWRPADADRRIQPTEVTDDG